MVLSSNYKFYMKCYSMLLNYTFEGPILHHNYISSSLFKIKPLNISKVSNLSKFIIHSHASDFLNKLFLDREKQSKVKVCGQANSFPKRVYKFCMENSLLITNFRDDI